MNSIADLFSDLSISYASLELKDYSKELYVEELALVHKSCLERVKSFSTGRICARKALENLNIKNYPIVRSEKGMPIWPKGVSGSISHTKKHCVAVAANCTAGMQIGFDLEETGRLKERLWPLTLNEEEILGIESNACNREEREKWATVIFSAKEAFYKAQYPITYTWIGFKDVGIKLNSDSSFKVTLLKGVPWVWEKQQTFEGKFYLDEFYTTAGISVSRPNCL